MPASFSSSLPAATGDRRGVEGSAAVAWFSRSRIPATADPRITGGEIGGRGEADYLYGRFRLAGDATVDGSFNVDSREYPSRFDLEVALPKLHLSAQAVAGLDEDQYGGTDFVLASDPWRFGGATEGTHAVLQAWVRGRKFEKFDQPILNPALSLAVDRLPLGRSTLDVELSAQTDFAGRNHPDSFGMVRAVWTPPRQEESGRLPGTGFLRVRAPEQALFLTGAYAFPLDTRHYARLMLGAGVRFFMDLARP